MSAQQAGAPAVAVVRGPDALARAIRQLRGASGQIFLGLLAGIMLGSIALLFARKGGTEATEQIVNGLSQGAIFALVAVGYTMVYGIIELINFAHGDVFTLSAFYSLIFGNFLDHVLHFNVTSLATGSGGGLLLALVITLAFAMPAAGITGMLIERVAYRRLRNAPKLAPLITAIGVSFLIEGFMQADFGPSDVPTGKGSWITGNALSSGSISIPWNSVFSILVAIAAMVGLQLFVQRTRLGKAMRATAQDRDAALLSGININRTISATFFIGSALAAVGAMVYSIKYDLVKWDLGFRFGIIAFTAAVLGGIGNILGAGLGGFLIGLILVISQSLIAPEWGTTMIFVMLILVLTLRPTGLLGVRVPDRA